MRILVVHTYYRLQGGEDIVVENEINLLRSIGNEVELLSFSNVGNRISKVLQLPFNFSSYFKTKEKIKEFRPDVIHLHNLHFGGSASVIYAIKRSKTAFVATLHNYRLLCPSATLFFNGKIFTDAVNKSFSWEAVRKGVYLKSKVFTFWLSSSMFLHNMIGTWKSVNKFIALGSYTKKIFSDSKLSEIAQDIIVKPNFCFKPSDAERSDRKYYLYIGRISEEKGIGLLLNAFAENGLPLIIGGTGPMDDEVLSYSKKYPNITFLGQLEKETINHLLTKTTALIFPSLWYETFGMAIIEAFSFGVPVITSALGQMKDTVNDQYNGLLFDQNKPGDLKDKVEFYESLTLKDKMSYEKNALQTYQEYYSPEKNSDQLMSIYRQALANSAVEEEEIPLKLSAFLRTNL